MSVRLGHWAFLAAAAIPCVALLLFCGLAIHEWWLISSHQIAVIPTPRRGMTSAPEVPAAHLVPFILGSAALAAVFAYALWRRSRGALVVGYGVILLLIAVPFIRRLV